MKTKILKTMLRGLPLGMTMASLALTPNLLRASSHMDAPLITLDPAANTTDVYAFLTAQGTNKYLTVALAVYPFEEPGIGPNDFRFDDNVLYELHVATSHTPRGRNVTSDLVAGRKTLSYQFQFNTKFKNQKTILQAYLGVITNVNDAAQNLVQTYSLTKIDYSATGKARTGILLGNGIVPPNNQGIATPFYNQGDNGENLAKPGVADESVLDRYTMQSITNLVNGYRAFAGQRDDGFYADIQSVFDLLQLRNPGVDGQAGFNVHTIVLQIPVSELGGDRQVVGVYATTSRKSVNVLRDLTLERIPRLVNDEIPPKKNSVDNNNGVDEDNIFRKLAVVGGRYIQVGRQGNPLFCEGLVALEDKDLYNRTSPTADATLFQKYALRPELAGLLNALVGTSAITSNRTDIAGIFIPDLIKIDLSTGPARLTGGGSDDAGFSRLSVFGGDALTSQISPGLPGFPAGTIPGGWPNGRRFGDDVLDIAVSALINDLRPATFSVANGVAGDNVDHNDIPYNKVFPYAATPHNGRNHTHH